MGKEMSCLKSYILSAMLAEAISYGLQRKSAIGKQKLSERCFTSFLGFDGIKRSIRKARNGGYTMIIIRNGRVIDPKSQTDAIMNMAVDQGKIIAMGPDTEEEQVQPLAQKAMTSLSWMRKAWWLPRG